MRLTFSLILAAGAAYAFSFAVDVLSGIITGAYSKSSALPIIIWSLISAVILFAAMAVSRCDKRMAWPYFAFALIAAFGGVVGARRDFVVAGLLAMNGIAIYTAPSDWLGRLVRYEKNLPKVR